MPATPGVPSRDMFSWFRKAPAPALARRRKSRPWPHRARGIRQCAADPGRKRTTWRVRWPTTLNALGHKASVKRDWVELEGGFSLVPQVVSVKPMDDSGVKTVTHDPDVARRAGAARSCSNFSTPRAPTFATPSRKASRAGRSSICRCFSMRCVQSRRRAWSWRWPGRKQIAAPRIAAWCSAHRCRWRRRADPAAAEHDFCPCCLFTSSVQAFEDL